MSDEWTVVDEATGGRKNQKREQMSLVPVEALEELARVYEFGARKYDRDNWRRGYNWSLSYDAAQRHMMKFWSGEDRDPDSGLLHVAHAMFHMAALCTFFIEELGNDDRPGSEPEVEQALIDEALKRASEELKKNLQPWLPATPTVEPYPQKWVPNPSPNTWPYRINEVTCSGDDEEPRYVLTDKGRAFLEGERFDVC